MMTAKNTSCRRSSAECEENRAAIQEGVSEKLRECTWQPRAACVSYRMRLYDRFITLCAADFAGCEFDREWVRVEQKHDVDQISECIAAE